MGIIQLKRSGKLVLKKDILQIQMFCQKCEEINSVERCIKCVLTKLSNSEEISDNLVINLHENLNLSNEELSIILDLLDLFNSFKKRDFKTSCKYQDSFCIMDNDAKFFRNNLNTDIFFAILENLDYEYDLKGRKIPKDCSLCIQKYKKKMKNLKEIYYSSKLHKHLLSKYGIFSFLMKKLIKIFPNFNFKFQMENNKDNFPLVKIDSYNFYDNFYGAEIGRNNSKYELYYTHHKNISSEILEYEKIMHDFFKEKIHTSLSIINFDLEKRIDQLIKNVNLLVSNYFSEISEINAKKLSLYISLDYLKFNKIFPFLLDPFIEEIFLDASDSYLYVNHQKWGRCNSFLKLTQEEINALKNYLRFESKYRLDQNSPSLMYVINNKYFHCRFSLDIYPSHWKNFSLDIRKLRKEIFTLNRLITLKTLNIELACFLILCLLLKINVTIAGEVNSGKTTLLNALDLFIPEGYRKIYLEETIETLYSPNQFAHQLKFLVKPDPTGKNNKKENEIYKLLHRSGDFIILGEILNNSETNAFFHCLSVGLTGLQTTHASDISGLLNRWLIHFKINKDCLNDLGLVIMMKKIGIERKILSINEIFYNNELNLIETHVFFEYQPNQDTWIPKFDFFKSNFYKKIQRYINLSNEKYLELKEILEESFHSDFFSNSDKSTTIFDPLHNVLPNLKKIETIIGD